MNKVRVAVVGVGYMGTFHALKYHSLEDAELVAVVDERSARASEVAERLGCRYFTSVEALLESGVELDAVSIATPTSLHHAIGVLLLKAGVHCLIEKPLADTSELAADLVRIARESSRVLLPGHIERFNPAVRAVWDRHPEISYIKAYRVGPMSFRSVDIDVVKDVMTHDIDIALFLTRSRGAEVNVVRVVAAPEQLNDIANAHLTIGQRCIVDLTASRLAIARRRKLRMFAVDGYYSVDCGRRTAVWLDREAYFAGIKTLQTQQLMGREPTPEEIFTAVGAEKIADPGRKGTDPGEPIDPLAAELQYFLARVRCLPESEVVLTAADGVAVLLVAERILGYLGCEVLKLGNKDSFRSTH